MFYSNGEVINCICKRIAQIMYLILYLTMACRQARYVAAPHRYFAKVVCCLHNWQPTAGTIGTITNGAMGYWHAIGTDGENKNARCVVMSTLPDDMSLVMRKPAFCIYAKTKTQISFAVTAKLISAFVFAT